MASSEDYDDDDFYLPVHDAEGKLVWEFDFRGPLRGGIIIYAERHGITIREAVRAAAGMLTLNMEIDPEGTLACLEKWSENPWLMRFKFESGATLVVDMAEYSKEILKRADADRSTVSAAAYEILKLHVDELRPTFRWIEKGEEDDDAEV